MPRDTLYDSQQQLESCALNITRRLGVVILGPFEHHGLPGKPLFGDFSYETITVNTACYGSNKPVEELNDHIEKATGKIIADLDRVIEELQQHRDRLAGELERVTANPPIDPNRWDTGQLSLNIG